MLRSLTFSGELPPVTGAAVRPPPNVCRTAARAGGGILKQAESDGAVTGR